MSRSIGLSALAALSSAMYIPPSPTPSQKKNENQHLQGEFQHTTPKIVAASVSNQSNSDSMFIKCVDGTRVVPYKTPKRADQLSRLRKEKFDVLVSDACEGVSEGV